KMTGFLANHAEFHKAFAETLNGDYTSLVKLMPGLLKGATDLDLIDKGSFAAFLNIFDMGTNLEQTIVGAVESGNFDTLDADVQKQISDNNERIQALVDRHPDIGQVVDQGAGERVDQLLVSNGLASAEDLAALEDPANKEQLALLEEYQGLLETQEESPLSAPQLARLEELKAELPADLSGLEALQSKQKLQQDFLSILGQTPFVDGDKKLDPQLLARLETLLLKAPDPEQAIAAFTSLQNNSGLHLEEMLKQPGFDQLFAGYTEAHAGLQAHGLSEEKVEALLKSQLQAGGFDAGKITTTLSTEVQAAAAFEQRFGRKIGDITLAPSSYMKMIAAVESQIKDKLPQLEGLRPEDLQKLELQLMTLLDDPRFLSEIDLPPAGEALSTELAAKIAAAGGIIEQTAGAPTARIVDTGAIESLLAHSQQMLTRAAEAVPGQRSALLERQMAKENIIETMNRAGHQPPLNANTPMEELLALAKGQTGLETAIATLEKPPAVDFVARLGAQLEELQKLKPEQREILLKLAPDKLAQALDTFTRYPLLREPGISTKSLEALLKLEPEQCRACVEKLSQLAEYANSNPQILNQGETLLDPSTWLDSRLADKSLELPEIATTEPAFRSILVKCGITDPNDIKALETALKAYLPADRKEFHQALSFLENLPPDALKTVFTPGFNFRDLSGPLFTDLNQLVASRTAAGTDLHLIQAEVTALLKQGNSGIHALSKEAKIARETDAVLAKIAPAVLAAHAEQRLELYTAVRELIGGLPEINPGLSDSLGQALEKYGPQAGGLDLLTDTLKHMSAHEREVMARHPEQLLSLIDGTAKISGAIDQALGKLERPAEGASAAVKAKFAQEQELRSALQDLFRQERFWSKASPPTLNVAELGQVLTQLAKVDDALTKTNLTRLLGKLDDDQLKRALVDLAKPDSQLLSHIQAYSAKMEATFFDAGELYGEALTAAKAEFFDGLMPQIAQNIDHPEFFQNQIQLASEIEAKFKGLPFKLSDEASQDLAQSLMKMFNDPAFMTGNSLNQPLVAEKLQLVLDQLASRKDDPQKLLDTLRGIREFADSRYVNVGLNTPGAIKGSFFEDLGKTVRGFDTMTSDLGSLAAVAAKAIPRFLSAYGASVAYQDAGALLERVTSGKLKTIPGSGPPEEVHPHAEALEYLALAGYAVNSADALTSLLEIGGIEALGLGPQLAMAGAELSIQMLLDYYHSNPEAIMPQKLKDLAKTLALSAALTSPEAFAAVQKIDPSIQDYGDLVLALGDSLLTQDNIQLGSNALQIYFEKQLIAINGHEIDPKSIEKITKALENIAAKGGEYATSIGRCLASWAKQGADLAKQGAQNLPTFEIINRFIKFVGNSATSGSQEALAMLNTVTSCLSQLAKDGHEFAIEGVRLLGEQLGKL
ncbi:MAG TPA: hypothetical protein V6D23_17975, partial [Candidatus Obscuribacterales bacterium]